MDTCVTDVQVEWTLPSGMTAEMLTDVPTQIYPGRPWVAFAKIDGKVLFGSPPPPF